MRKNVSFLFGELMKTDKTRYKVDDCGERPCIKRTNPGRETVDQCILDHVLDSVFICSSVSLCSLIKDWGEKKNTASELKYVWRYGIWRYFCFGHKRKALV